MFNAQTATATGAAAARRAHLLVYDIPKGAIPSPAAMLWRLGARINLSCWVIPDSRVSMLPLKEWAAKGVIVELVRFDERDGDTIIRLAREALQREALRWRDTLEEGTLVVRAACAKVTIGEDGVKQWHKAGGLASGHVRRARQFLSNATECALAFDLTADVAHVMEGLREMVKAKEEVFAGLVKEAKEKAQGQTVTAPVVEA